MLKFAKAKVLLYSYNQLRERPELLQTYGAPVHEWTALMGSCNRSERDWGILRRFDARNKISAI
jgi:hypothetical protein